jgi:hypothetical protein
MGLSKSQPYIESCQFIQALLKIKVAIGKRIPSSELAKDPCASFVSTDGVLLEVCNLKEEC